MDTGAAEARRGEAERRRGTKEFPFGGSKGQWKDVLNGQQISRIVAANEEMRRFGYRLPEFDYCRRAFVLKKPQPQCL